MFGGIMARKRSAFRRGDFMLISQSGLSAIQQEGRAHRLSWRDVRVLLEMLANVGHENMVMVSQVDLGKLTGIDEAALSKSVRVLREGGYIERVENRRGWYRVNPKLVWKGTGEAHHDMIARAAEAAYFEKYEELKEQRSEDDERRSAG